MKIKKGDTIQIRVGKDRGKIGKVLKANPGQDAVVVEGLNMFKKHQRSKKQGEKGQIVTVPRPLNISKIMLYCSGCKKGVRAGFRREGEEKIRYCKKCQSTI